MTRSFVDTDILIRYLTGDDAKKQAAAAALFDQVSSGELLLMAPDTVISDAVFVLSSPKLYNLPRTQVRDLLTALLRNPNFKVQNRSLLLHALFLYADCNLDFGDVILIVSMRRAKCTILYSFDHDFDQFDQIERRVPPAAAG